MAGGDSKLKKSSSVGAVNTNPESQTMSEPKMIKKFGVMKGEGDNSNNPEFAHMSHFSDISKLRAQAPAGDERLNDYNLERIHRFVDQPLEKLGDERKLLREGMKNLGSSVREVVSPFVNEEAPNFVLDKKFGQKIAPKAKVNHTVQMTKPDGTVETLSYDISAKATHSDLSMRKASLVKYKKNIPQEHDTGLGTLSRYGDGDGSFWDRWLTPTSDAGKGSYKTGSVIPRSGFKKFNDGGFAKGLVDCGNPARVNPYSLYQDEATRPGVKNVIIGGNAKRHQYSRDQIKVTHTKKKDFMAKEHVKGMTTRQPSASSLKPSKYDNQYFMNDDDIMSSDTESSESDFDEDAIISSLSNPRHLRESVNIMKRRVEVELKGTAPIVQRKRAVNLHFKKDTLDKVTAENYFGKGSGNWGAAKESFYHLHHQLEHQKSHHYTQEQYESLVHNILDDGEVTSDSEEEEEVEEKPVTSKSPDEETERKERTKLMRLAGMVPSESDGDAVPHENEVKRLLIPKLEMDKAAEKKKAENDVLNSEELELNIDYLNQIAGRFNQATARTKFLYCCTLARDGLGIPPRMGPIIRKSRTIDIQLSHQGMGDELAVLFSKALGDIPEVQRVDVSDNRLSDIGCYAILHALEKKDDLYSLVIGSNKIDGAAAEKLAEMMANPDCPLKVLGVSDADLDDGECVEFIDALATNKNLTDLDMSRNIIGSDESLNVVQPELTTGGEAIAAYLASEGCKLKRLNLQWNLIRFNSAVEIGDALAVNDSLESLNLNYNAFGPDGGMAVGQALIENTRLQHLKLQDNGITPQAAFCIAVACRQNSSLRSIDLSGNPLGQMGGKAIMALPIELTSGLDVKFDKCNLQLLDDKCWFDPETPSGVYTADASVAKEEILELREDFSERSEELILIIDKTLEAQVPGGVALKPSIKKPISGEMRVQLDMVKNQLHQRLDLSEPYDRAVLIELLRIVAQREGCALVLPEEKPDMEASNFVRIKYFDEYGKMEVVELNRIITETLPNEVDEEFVKFLSGERDPAEIFRMFDKDGSGEIDKEELKMVFKQIGKDASEREIERVMTQFDIDGSGSIELDEFTDFLEQLNDEMSDLRLKEKKMVVPGNKEVWRPPGVGYVEFKAIFQPKLSLPGKGSSTDNDTLDRVLNQVKKTTGEASTMLIMSLSMMRLGVEEGQRVFEELLKVHPKGDRVETLKLLLPVMANPQQARVFIDMNLRDRNPYKIKAKVTVSPKELTDHGGPATIVHIDPEDEDVMTVQFEDDNSMAVVEKSQLTLTDRYATVTAETEKRRLQQLLGNAYYPIMGIPTAHYKLDLSSKNDRMCLQKLAAINNSETHARRSEKLGDTSQKGNWMNFRNEVFRGAPFTVTSWWLDPVPQQGILEFDYVSTFRPIDSVKPLSEERFLALLKVGFYQNEDNAADEINEAREKLKSMETELKYSKEFQYGLWSGELRSDKEGKDKFGLELATLLGEITPELVDQLEEEANLAEEKEKAKASSRPGTGTPGSRPRTREEPASGRTASNARVLDDSAKDALRQRMGLLGGGGGGIGTTALGGAQGGVFAKGTFIPMGATGGRGGPTFVPKFNAGNRFSVALMKKAGNDVGVFSKMATKLSRMSQLVTAASKLRKKAKKIRAKILLEQMQDLICMRWITALQARFLVEKFSNMLREQAASADEWSLKLDLVCTLHSRITDLYNFDIVISCLSLEEQAKITFRLGWLNTWNPLKPDFYYELQHTRREERLVSKALLHLAVVEPGENWLEETFAWSRFDKAIPGWELPRTWFTEDGMPSKGVLKLTYYSGEGKGLEECDPRWRLRHAIMGICLARPPAFIRDDPDRIYKSRLPAGKPILEIAQKLLEREGIQLYYSSRFKGKGRKTDVPLPSGNL
ncbi:hypothetical protein TrCOL_g3436 [Triparma columacea]|uniref:EF-hand domain-containing protein n=1 Tax=Triparma columacea TaxID=722753 RepID=A0A9W7GG65_9STRA|nr:hypothetical protein TrCOL_g3436 [Triparma columacea]